MILTTKRLLLRPWCESDAEDLYKYASDPQVGPPAGWLPHKSIEESRNIILTTLSKKHNYAICLKEDERAIGSISLHRKDIAEEDDEFELGYWIARPFWGKGLVVEASNTLINYAFKNLAINRLWCGYYEGNLKSRRVMDKLGFVYHHETPNITLKNLGEIRTGHVMLLTRDKWEKDN